MAFSYAINCLIADLDYMSCMRKVLEMGGDTDTNCAIVGAIIGARIGF